VNTDYEWMKFYEAAVLETNSEVLPEAHRIRPKSNRTTCGDSCD